ncbi:hypothetical protein NL429_29795, partial [Klebsiella pneumoniae]|nr:hypothetical protein [Klebsiella pneumoniae]
GRMDRRQRDQSALRAEFFWEDDRRLMAIELGDRLGSKPEKTVARLRATPQGCDWLLGRWASLQGVLDAGKTWDEAQSSIALD